jgi:hypothetical protein
VHEHGTPVVVGADATFQAREGVVDGVLRARPSRQQADTAIAAAWPPRSVSPMVSDQSLARDSTTDGSSSSHAASPSATTLLRKS